MNMTLCHGMCCGQVTLQGVRQRLLFSVSAADHCPLPAIVSHSFSARPLMENECNQSPETFSAFFFNLKVITAQAVDVCGITCACQSAATSEIVKRFLSPVGVDLYPVYTMKQT